MIKLITSMLLLFTAVVASFAQTSSPTVIATGGSFFSSPEGYSISYTVGEVSVRTYSLVNGNYFVTEGFQQGTYRKLSDIVFSEVKVYPNPVSDLLYIGLPVRDDISSYNVFVYSCTGQCIYIRKYYNLLSNSIFTIDFSVFAKSIYFVKIQSINGQFSKSFKIEKL